MTPPQTATPPEIDPRQLRTALGRLPTGVTIVTAVDEEGRPAGTTVSAVISLSLDPPLVLVALDRRSQTLAAVREHGAFAVNVLATEHEHVSNAFARSGNHAAWDAVAHASGITGSPLLDGAHLTIDCALHRLDDGGDHEILIGRVLDARHGDDGTPLVYYGGAYAELQPRSRTNE